MVKRSNRKPGSGEASLQRAKRRRGGRVWPQHKRILAEALEKLRDPRWRERAESTE
jgi:hypothetical protein